MYLWWLFCTNISLTGFQRWSQCGCSFSRSGDPCLTPRELNGCILFQGSTQLHYRYSDAVRLR